MKQNLVFLLVSASCQVLPSGFGLYVKAETFHKTCIDPLCLLTGMSKELVSIQKLVKYAHYSRVTQLGCSLQESLILNLFILWFFISGQTKFPKYSSNMFPGEISLPGFS